MFGSGEDKRNPLGNIKREKDGYRDTRIGYCVSDNDQQKVRFVIPACLGIIDSVKVEVQPFLPSRN